MDRVLYFKDYTPLYRHFQMFAFQSTDGATSLDTGESHTFNFYNVGTRSPFTATLVWMDPAGESLGAFLFLPHTSESGESSSQALATLQ
jgi:hypothetical protein